MFEWYLDGHSITVIKDKLLQNGVMTRNSKKEVLITPEKLGGERVVHPLKLHRSP